MARLALTVLCGACLAGAGSAQEESVVCLDKLYPRVRTDYRLLKLPDYWSNHVPVVNVETTDIGGTTSGEQQRSHEPNNSTLGVKNHRRKTDGKSTINSKYEKLESQQYILSITYDFRVPLNESLNGEDDVISEISDDEADPRPDEVNEEELQDEDHAQGFQNKKGRGNGDNKAADLFSNDFTLDTSELLVPCWWLSLGDRSHRNTYLTVALIGGDILEDLDSREEEIRQKYGDYMYMVFRAEERRTERKWKELSSNASRDIVTETDIPEKNIPTPVDKAWRAIDELRILWQSRPIAHFMPRKSNSFSWRSRADDNHASENMSFIADGSQLSLGGRVRQRHINQSKKNSNSHTSLRTDGRQSFSVRHTDIYSPNNISDELFPGSLPSHLINYHNRFPSASSWYSFRHAIDYHMIHTGVLHTPLLTAATYSLPAATCLKTPGDPESTSKSPFSQSSGSFGDERRVRTLNANDKIPIDITPLLQTWLRKTLPWERQTSKITVVMFTTDDNPRQQSPMIFNKSQKTRYTLHGKSQTPAEGSESLPPPAAASVTSHTTGPTPPTEHQSQPSPSNSEGDGQDVIGGNSDQSPLNVLLHRSPPRLFVNYRLDGK